MKTFKVTYKCRVYHRKPDPSCSMDTLPDGFSIEEKVVHVLAPTKALAVAYCERSYDKDYTLVSVEDGVEIDAIVGVDHGLGFNWRR